MKIFTVFISLFLFSFQILAQKQGKIVYKNLLNEPEINLYTLFRQDTIIEVAESYSSFMNTHSTMLQMYKNGLKVCYATLKNNNNTKKKTAIYFNQNNVDNRKMNIEYLEEYKEILGFKCQKAKIQIYVYDSAYSKTIKQNIIVYFTTEINIPAFKGLKGFPLEHLESVEIDGQEYKTHSQVIDIQYNIQMPEVLNFRTLYPDYEFKNFKEMQKSKKD